MGTHRHPSTALCSKCRLTPTAFCLCTSRGNTFPKASRGHLQQNQGDNVTALQSSSRSTDPQRSLTPQYWSPLTIWGGMALGLPAFALISSRRALSWEMSTSSYLMFFPSRILVTSLCWDLIWKRAAKATLSGCGEELRRMNARSVHQPTPARGGLYWRGRGGHAAQSREQSRAGGDGNREKHGGRAGRERRDGAGWGGSYPHEKDARPRKGTRGAQPCSRRTAQPLTSREPVTDVLYTFRALMLRPRPLPAHSPGGGRSEGGAGRRRPACDCGDQWSRRARACGAASGEGPAAARGVPGAPKRFTPPRGTALHEWSRAALFYTQNIGYKQVGKDKRRYKCTRARLDEGKQREAERQPSEYELHNQQGGEARGPARCAGCSRRKGRVPRPAGLCVKPRGRFAGQKHGRFLQGNPQSGDTEDGAQYGRRAGAANPASGLRRSAAIPFAQPVVDRQEAHAALHPESHLPPRPEQNAAAAEQHIPACSLPCQSSRRPGPQQALAHSELRTWHQQCGDRA